MMEAYCQTSFLPGPLVKMFDNVLPLCICWSKTGMLHSAVIQRRAISSCYVSCHFCAVVIDASHLTPSSTRQVDPTCCKYSVPANVLIWTVSYALVIIKGVRQVPGNAGRFARSTSDIQRAYDAAPGPPSKGSVAQEGPPSAPPAQPLDHTTSGEPHMQCCEGGTLRASFRAASIAQTSGGGSTLRTDKRRS